jgi:hypothetical protein
MTEQAHPPTELPPRETILLAAFEGWNDAGSAASQALEHLHEVWGAEQVDELDPEEYHDFQVNRPVLGIGPDGRREITWPTTAVAVATAPRSGRQVVLVHGIEPSMRWRRAARHRRRSRCQHCRHGRCAPRGRAPHAPDPCHRDE